MKNLNKTFIGFASTALGFAGFAALASGSFAEGKSESSEPSPIEYVSESSNDVKSDLAPGTTLDINTDTGELRWGTN